MRAIDADRLKEHIDKLPALPDGNFAGNHSALKALINMQPSVEPETCGDCVSRQAARNALLNKGQHSKRYKLGETWELNLMEIEETLLELPSVEPKKCRDCISRQALQEWIKDKTFGDIVVASEHNFDCLPSVEPERKPGKWIKAIDPDVNAWTGGHTCSECGRACVQMSMNYCANCGAPMEVQNGKENS